MERSSGQFVPADEQLVQDSPNQSSGAVDDPLLELLDSEFARAEYLGVPVELPLHRFGD